MFRPAPRHLVAPLALLPAAAAVLAWGMAVDLAQVVRWGLLPFLLALGLAEATLARRQPGAFTRFAWGLGAGLVAVATWDTVRLAAGAAFRAIPDFVPMWGQMILNEPIGIAPSLAAVALGYGYHALLIGALGGGAVALLAGRRLSAGTGALGGAVLGLGLALFPQFQLLTIATGRGLWLACATAVAGLALAGAVYGAIMKRWAPAPAARGIVFLRHGQKRAAARP